MADGNQPKLDVTRLDGWRALVVSRTHEQPLTEWFGQSKVINLDGTPAVLYRGEHGVLDEGEHLQSRLNSLSFSDDSGAANTYALSPNNNQLDRFAEAPRVTPVHLKIENPIIENQNDPFVELSDLINKLGSKEARRIAIKFDHHVRYTGNWDENYARKYDSVAKLLDEKPDELKNLYFNAHEFLDNPVEVKRLKTAGYDGAIHVGNGETATSLEYRVFDSCQVRSAICGRSIFWRSGATGLAAAGGLLPAKQPRQTSSQPSMGQGKAPVRRFWALPGISRD